jgi:hypothetical protein
MEEMSANVYAILLESLLPFRTAVFSVVGKLHEVGLRLEKIKPERNVFMQAKFDDIGVALEGSLKGSDILAVH